MNMKKLMKQSILFLFGGLSLGCVGSNSVHPTNLEGLFQQRIFFSEKPFVQTDVEATIAYPTNQDSDTSREKGMGLASLGSAIVGSIAPQLIERGVDMFANSIVALSGKDDQSTQMYAEASNFFYKNEMFNMPNKTRPQLNILFVSAVFGDSKDRWIPTGLDHDERNVFKALNIVGKPNFYMEAKLFPIPGNKYMEIVPTYIFYNRLLNSKGMDTRRDLAINFSFFDLENQSDSNLISQESIVFKDILVGKEYGSKELAKVRTKFMQMPSISSEKQGYSGAYNLKVSVTETRDINEWLAALGEEISNSKNTISSKLYVTKEEKIRYEENLQKAKLELKSVQAQIIQAKENDTSELEMLELETKLVSAEAKVKRKQLGLTD
ncbi:MAG: Unknown protein [uncultured Sulfurovum sp.]|uniref:Lipoprotein n=1 Tax=uncultured Sulfurovum sp. TaxID=269237 RepID=A0A6S6RXQ2_9BACT|nr:MAG: Unknown protein [uncultured Sulfurovum sp.]